MIWLWRLLIKKMEMKYAQAICPHDYKVVLEHGMSTMYDVYCPICEHKRENLKSWKWKQLKNIQDARKEYEGTA